MDHIPAQLLDQDDRTWITTDDAARILNINEETVRWYVSRRVFQKTGRGKGMRVLLGEVRSYANRRNPRSAAGGLNSGKPRKPRHAKSPNGVVQDEQRTPFEIALTARVELSEIEEKLTLLQTRKAELEDVIKAVETVERFAKLTTEGLE